MNPKDLVSKTLADLRAKNYEQVSISELANTTQLTRNETIQTVHALHYEVVEHRREKYVRLDKLQTEQAPAHFSDLAQPKSAILNKA